MTPEHSGLDREAIPDWRSYADKIGLHLHGRGPWLTTGCELHGGSDSLRVNAESGGWICMSCLVSGGDTLAYHIKRTGMLFVDAARELGCWRGGNHTTEKPRPFSARDALTVLERDSLVAWTCAQNLAYGVTLTKADRDRLTVAARRIAIVREATNAGR